MCTQILLQQVKMHKKNHVHCLARTLQLKTMIITLQFKQVGFYVVPSPGEVLESTHINIVVGQWIRGSYINHLFLQRLGKRPVLCESWLHSH